MGRLLIRPVGSREKWRPFQSPRTSPHPQAVLVGCRQMSSSGHHQDLNFSPIHNSASHSHKNLAGGSYLPVRLPTLTGGQLVSGRPPAVVRSAAGPGNCVGGFPARQTLSGSLVWIVEMRAPGLATAGLKLQRAGTCSKVGLHLHQVLPRHARQVRQSARHFSPAGKRFSPSAVLEMERPASTPVQMEIPGSLQTLEPLGGGGGDPWEDPQWRQYKWTVYRGVAYDLTAFIDRHPAGAWLVRLAIGRDCTALFESYHLRPEVAVAHLQRLPVLEGFPVVAVPRSPYPNDSDFYNVLRRRVRQEVFKGAEARGAHRSGTDGAAALILLTAAAAYGLFAYDTNVFTGLLLGVSGAWIGLTVQHCGNHGAMSTIPWVNKALGRCSDLVGGSSLAWQYHHQVSHHIHCNDDALDEDVFSAFPALRFDARLPRHWYHQYQHIYMWATFPFLQVAFQFGDMDAILGGRTKGATMYGARLKDQAAVVAGKLAHFGLLLGVPWILHGFTAAAIGAAAYTASQGVVLASTFAVSHNVDEAKPQPDVRASLASTRLLMSDVGERDWAIQQVLTSANYGGVIENFLTGGLSLQVEHHLFPAISFLHYPAIAAIVEDECRKRDIPYARYNTLGDAIAKFVGYMKRVGAAEQVPMSFLGPASIQGSPLSKAAMLEKF